MQELHRRGIMTRTYPAWLAFFPSLVIAHEGHGISLNLAIHYFSEPVHVLPIVGVAVILAALRRARRARR